MADPDDPGLCVEPDFSLALKDDDWLGVRAGAVHEKRDSRWTAATPSSNS